MFTFRYAVDLGPDRKDGGCVVTFDQFPEAITQGDTVEEALAEAQDCLDEVLASRIESGEPIPEPLMTNSKYHASPTLQMSVKASLYLAIKEAELKNTDLAKALDIDEKAVRRLMDPRHPSKLPAMESVLGKLGKQPRLQVA